MITKEKIKFIRGLHRKKNRMQEQLFLIEGPKMLTEALKYKRDAVQEVFHVEEWEPPKSLPKEKCSAVSEKILRQLSLLKQPQKVVAICSFMTPITEQSDLILALDNVQDPGNFGTILRLAGWFGVSSIVVSKDSVEAYNPKVVQASMGAVFHVDVSYVDLETYFKKTDLPVYGALLEGANVYQTALPAKAILLLGNEGNGISSSIQPFISHPIHIPKFGNGESLNVAMATGIFLSEFKRS